MVGVEGSKRALYYQARPRAGRQLTVDWMGQRREAVWTGGACGWRGRRETSGEEESGGFEGSLQR